MNCETITVLSIEDDAGDARLIQRMLAGVDAVSWGLPEFNIEFVDTLAAGLARLDAGGIDVVLTDLDLPDSRAGDTFVSIRAHAPRMPIVVLTGREDEELALQTVRAGAENYLYKAEATGSLLARTMCYAIERQQARETLQKAYDELEKRVKERTTELEKVNRELETELTARQRAEAELRETNELMTNLLDHAPVSIYVTGIDGKVRLVNHYWEENNAMKREEATERTLSQIFPAKAARRFLAENREVIDTETPIAIEEGVETSYGSRNFLTTKFPLKNAKGEIEAVGGISIDITEQKRAEKLFRGTFEQAGVGITHVTPDGKWLRVNKKFCDIVGYSCDELRELTFADITHPDDHATDAEYTRWLLSGDMLSIAVEKRYIRKNGDIIWVRVTAAPVRGETGKIQYIISVVEDITRRKRVEEALRKSEEQYRLIVEATTDGLWDWNIETGEVYYSAAWMKMLEEDMVDSRYESWESRLHPHDKEYVLSSLNDHLAGKTAHWQCEHRLRTAAGEWKWVQARGRITHRDAQGNPQRMVGTLTDITARKRIEEELYKREERLELAFLGADLGLWDWNVQTGAVSFNQQWAEMLGYSLDEIEPHVSSWERLAHPDDLAQAKELLDAHLEGCTPFYETEHRLRAKSGEWVWVLDRGKVVEWDTEGKPRRMAGTHLDITARKRLERQFAEKQKLLEAITQLVPDILYLYDVKQKSHIYINKEVARLLGYSAAEIKERGATLILELIHPEDIPKVRKHIETVARAANDAIYDLEYRIKNKEGGYSWFYVREQVYERDEGGTPRTLFGVVQDITKRKRAEAALRESEERFRTISELVSDYAYSVRIESETGISLTSEWATETLMRDFGFTPEEIAAGRMWETSIYPDDASIVVERLQTLLAGQPSISEYRIFTKTGEIRWLRDYAHPVFAEDSHRVVRIVGAAQDITERKGAEEERERYAAELRRSNEELEQFAYAVSHDLLEPLRMVHSYAGLLEEEHQEKLNAEAQEFLGYITDGAARMQRMIKDLLEYSRLSTRGKEFTPTDCEKLLERARHNLKFDIENAAAVVTHAPLPTVPADATQLERVFQNLLGNALKYRGAAPPRIHIAAKEREDDWLFSVQDNGIGIAPEYFEDIFVVFRRLHTQEEYEGTGVGLATCKKIVERHGGKIWVESKPGSGATFYFTIPK